MIIIIIFKYNFFAILHYLLTGRRGIIPSHVPNTYMATDNRAKRIGVQLLPSPTSAVELYEQSGGRIRDQSNFGIDPIAENPTKCTTRLHAFYERFPSFEEIFSNLVNGSTRPFKNALKFYISITRRLAHS